MIDGKNFFDQPINGKLKTYENILEIATGEGDDYTTGCFLDYSYFKEKYKMIAKDLSKQYGGVVRGWQKKTSKKNYY